MQYNLKLMAKYRNT